MSMSTHSHGGLDTKLTPKTRRIEQQQATCTVRCLSAHEEDQGDVAGFPFDCEGESETRA